MSGVGEALSAAPRATTTGPATGGQAVTSLRRAVPLDNNAARKVLRFLQKVVPFRGHPGTMKEIYRSQGASMSYPQLQPVLRHINRLLGRLSPDPGTDTQMLDRFTLDRDE